MVTQQTPPFSFGSHGFLTGLRRTIGVGSQSSRPAIKTPLSALVAIHRYDARWRCGASMLWAAGTIFSSLRWAHFGQLSQSVDFVVSWNLNAEG